MIPFPQWPDDGPGLFVAWLRMPEAVSLRALSVVFEELLAGRIRPACNSYTRENALAWIAVGLRNTHSKTVRRANHSGQRTGCGIATKQTHALPLAAGVPLMGKREEKDFMIQ